MKARNNYLGREMESPVGVLTLLASEEGLAGIYFEERYDGEWVGGQRVFGPG